MGFQFSLFLSLIRSLFPRWDFFDQIAFSFIVDFKMSSDTQWKRLSFAQKHSSSRLVFNPFVNEALAHSSVIEQFARDIQELQASKPNFADHELNQLTTYRLLCSLLHVKLKHENLHDGTFQFKITAQSQNQNVEIFTSGILPLVNV